MSEVISHVLADLFCLIFARFETSVTPTKKYRVANDVA